MTEPIEQIAEAVTGGVAIGQSADSFKNLPEAVRQRVVMDITANTLMQEGRNALLRAGNLLTMEVKPEGAIEAVWIDQAGNMELATRIEVALRILAGNPESEIEVVGRAR